MLLSVEAYVSISSLPDPLRIHRGKNNRIIACIIASYVIDCLVNHTFLPRFPLDFDQRLLLFNHRWHYLSIEYLQDFFLIAQ